MLVLAATPLASMGSVFIGFWKGNFSLLPFQDINLKLK